MSETLTQIFDFISAKWDTVLALFGGATGLIAFLVTFIKIICPLITSKINRKSGVNTSLGFLIEKYNVIEDKVNTLRTEITDSVVNKVVSELDKREEQKQLVYNQILGKTEDIKQEVTEMAQKALENVEEKAPTLEELQQSVEDLKEKTNDIANEIDNKTTEIVDKAKEEIKKVVIINE